jgi:hypothetical protein
LQRGHSLENENIELAVKKLNIPLDTVELDCGVWVADDEKSGVSPDGHEKSDKPTFAFEAKALNAQDHLKTVLLNRIWKGEIKIDSKSDMWAYLPTYVQEEDYNPLKLIEKLDYKFQVLSYFKINPDLQTLYFCMYNPVFLQTPALVHEILVVHRADVVDEVQDLLNGEKATLNVIEQFVNLLGGNNNG